MVRYTGIFNNTQVDYTDNSPNTVDVTVTITDMAVLYNMAYTEVVTGTTEYTFTFDPPATATGVVISYTNDGGVTWASVGPFAPTSPIVFSLSNTSDRQFVVYMQRSDGSDTIDFTTIQDVEFELSELPAVQRTVDNDEDKYTPIRSKSYEIQAHTNNDFSILNFKDGTDNQYKVEISIGGEIIFTGWLSVSDLRQRFQPDPNVLVLTATDGLGFLKDIPLVDFDGEIFLNENKIIKYIAASLYQTGLELPIVVEMNIMESTAPLSASGHFYNFCYLHALTFETGINEFDDCYTVLEKIFTENSFVTQEKNVWYIRRIDEVDAQDQKQVRFAYDGTVDGDEPVETFTKEVGSDMSQYSIGFMNEDAEVSIISAHKFVKHNFKYEFPREIPCNRSFERGDLIGDDGTEDVDGVTYTRKKYNLDCWGKYWSSSTGDQAATIDIEVKRLFDEYDYEFSRYINIPQETTGKFHFIMSDKIYVDAGDKMDIDISMSLSGDVSGTDGYRDQVLQVRLYADDGTTWTYHGKTSITDDYGYWQECGSDFAITDLDINFYVIEGDREEDQRNQVSLYDPKTAPFPRSGYIKICVFQSNLFRDTYDTHIHKIDFTYYAKINGSFSRFDGHYHKSEQDGNMKFKREKDVYISDNCKRLHKGCLMKADGDNFVVTEGFFNYAVFPSGPPSDEYIHPFGEIQNQDVWNQFNRTFVAFEGTLDGLDTDLVDGQSRPDLPGFMHRFYLKDSSELTNNKAFVPLHFEQDLYLCEWDTYFVEVYDSTIPKNYLGHEFKYIESDTN